MFSVWVTFGERKWITFAERRGSGYWLQIMGARPVSDARENPGQNRERENKTPQRGPRRTGDHKILGLPESSKYPIYPELELSNNLAENSIRPVALGRKNWIHIGSPPAGPKVAAILSVVESCRRLEISVRDYFSTILPGLADLPIRCLPDLTPAVWVGRIHRLKRPG